MGTEAERLRMGTATNPSYVAGFSAEISRTDSEQESEHLILPRGGERA